MICQTTTLSSSYPWNHQSINHKFFKCLLNVQHILQHILRTHYNNKLRYYCLAASFTLVLIRLTVYSATKKLYAAYYCVIRSQSLKYSIYPLPFMEDKCLLTLSRKSSTGLYLHMRILRTTKLNFPYFQPLKLSLMQQTLHGLDMNNFKNWSRRPAEACRRVYKLLSWIITWHAVKQACGEQWTHCVFSRRVQLSLQKVYCVAATN
jgi:hypothetical protein